MLIPASCLSSSSCSAIAAEPIATSLTKRGGTLIIPPEGFFIKDKEGPLKEGELERSAAWAQQIVART